MAWFWERAARTYAMDWSLSVLMLLVSTLLDAFTDPVKRAFDVNDITIARPLVEQPLLPFALLIITLLVPAVLVFVIGQRWVRSELDFFFSILGLFQAIAFSVFLSAVIRPTLGVLSPDFLARCQWDPVEAVCTGRPGLVRLGRKSFPSNIASLAFAANGFLTLWLIGKVRPHDGHGHLWKLIACATPVFFSMLTSMEPVVNNRNHEADALGGAIVGIGCAVVAYWLHYPPPWSNAGPDGTMLLPNAFRLTSSARPSDQQLLARSSSATALVLKAGAAAGASDTVMFPSGQLRARGSEAPAITGSGSGGGIFSGSPTKPQPQPAELKRSPQQQQQQQQQPPTMLAAPESRAQAAQHTATSSSPDSTSPQI